METAIGATATENSPVSLGTGNGSAIDAGNCDSTVA